MAGDTQSVPAKIFGAPCPSFRDCSVPLLFDKYMSELSGKGVWDPLGREVRFLDYQFPKLIQLQLKDHATGRAAVDPNTGKPLKAKASLVLKDIRSGSFDSSLYVRDVSRSQTLFWIPEVIRDPDSIHTNNHHLIQGESFYVKRYAKSGSPFKLVFTTLDQRLSASIVTTSFWVREKELRRFVVFATRLDKIRAAPIGRLSCPLPRVQGFALK